MSRPPAIVIIARHGARLDAADPQWHLTSPAPYDPPLTYGGWRQSQALGARIASIIDVRENAPDGPATEGIPDVDIDEKKPRRRRHKVIIHTSPYLRCIQTSIAISAGIRQYDGSDETGRLGPHPNPHALHSGDPHLRNSPLLSAIPEPKSSSLQPRKGRTVKRARTPLRIDAFLGEWLSPEYYEDITPPPASKMMVAGAKADLLRPADPIEGIMLADQGGKKSGNFPGGWNGGLSKLREEPPAVLESPFEDVSALAQALPRIARANSHHIGDTHMHPASRTSRIIHGKRGGDGGYEPPVPAYAISPTQSIPQGYVAHARDACVKVDFQWDSIRPPLEWGTGGVYGEDWSALHKRFRKGFNEMIQWYSSHNWQQRPEEKDGHASGSEKASGAVIETSEDEDDKDDDADIVLLLVTHGAGSNALIGALTNQPVLIDVGMASLTMAVRRPVDQSTFTLNQQDRVQNRLRRRSSVDVGMLADYEVKLLASTEHLRAGSRFLNTTRTQRAPSLPVREKSPYRYERHVVVPHHHHHHHNHHHTSSNPLHTSEKSSIDATSSRPGNGSTGRTTPMTPASAGSSPGLWSMPSPKPAIEKSSSGSFDIGAPSMSTSAAKHTNGGPKDGSLKLDTANGKHRQVFNQDNVNNGTVASPGTLSPNGLWGPPAQSPASERERGPKRRWTLSEA